MEQTSEPDSDRMIIRLEIENNYDQYPRGSNEKSDNMQQQRGTISREMETLRKNQMEILEIKETVTEMKNSFDGLINRLNMAEKKKKSVYLKQCQQKLSKLKCKEKKECKTTISENCGEKFLNVIYVQ